ncbi:hypothetical protein MADA3029_740056 [Vibrio nigripulchritudo MADA3029]|nr:hypothetical protein VIBNIMADA3020_1180041 [Vibrio nigripulchritudo MADA3020]CCN54135.1 hypothetical protein VIBNIMADA3021_510058 [Vibrio nigripulchritudo MADA3021]CCN61205.1 hypothetical protein MADA3029_740056 [Vibrio nigripulchritudo MADA3029]
MVKNQDSDLQIKDLLVMSFLSSRIIQILRKDLLSNLLLMKFDIHS